VLLVYRLRHEGTRKRREKLEKFPNPCVLSNLRFRGLIRVRGKQGRAHSETMVSERILGLTEQIAPDVVLMAQLIRAIAKYDPAYTEKVKLVVEAINAKLSQCEQLCLADVDRHVDFDCGRYIRLLCRRGYLTSAFGENRRVSGYVRSISWPPKPEFFEQGAIGVAYYLQTWFRYYLQQWIESSMSEVESHEGVYSWDYSHADAPLRERLRGSNIDGGFIRSPGSDAVVMGNQVDRIGGIRFQHGLQTPGSEHDDPGLGGSYLQRPIPRGQPASRSDSE